MSILTLLPTVLMPIIKSIFPDKAQQNEAKAKLLEMSLAADAELVKQQGHVITAEAKSESWLPRNIRPLAILIMLVIVANNFIFAPYLAAFGVVVPVLPIPEQMWYVILTGLTGYITSKGFERVTKMRTDAEIMNIARLVNGELNQEQVDRINKHIKGNK
jgi:hypothetical protein